jgi:hypothetical protein
VQAAPPFAKTFEFAKTAMLLDNRNAQHGPSEMGRRADVYSLYVPLSFQVSMEKDDDTYNTGTYTFTNQTNETIDYPEQDQSNDYTAKNVLSLWTDYLIQNGSELTTGPTPSKVHRVTTTKSKKVTRSRALL